MTENEDAPIIVACRFKWSPRLYDYLSRIDVKPGDRAVVETKNGETIVEVVEIRDESDVAEKFILRLAPEPEEPKVPEMEDGE